MAIGLIPEYFCLSSEKKLHVALIFWTEYNNTQKRIWGDLTEVQNFLMRVSGEAALISSLW